MKIPGLNRKNIFDEYSIQEYSRFFRYSWIGPVGRVPPPTAPAGRLPPPADSGTHTCSMKRRALRDIVICHRNSKAPPFVMFMFASLRFTL
jgi:hypothetical protein